MPGKDGTGRDGISGPKKVNPGTPTPRRKQTVDPKRGQNRPGGGGRRNRGKACPFRGE